MYDEFTDAATTRAAFDVVWHYAQKGRCRVSWGSMTSLSTSRSLL